MTKKKISLLAGTAITLFSLTACHNSTLETEVYTEQSYIEQSCTEPSSVMETTVVESEYDTSVDIVKAVMSMNMQSSFTDTSDNDAEQQTDIESEETTESVKNETQINEADQLITVENKNTIKYSTTSLIIRSGPSTSYELIGSYSEGEEVKQTGICNNGWVRVSKYGHEGYVYGEYLTNEKPAQATTSNSSSKSSTSSTSNSSSDATSSKEQNADSVYDRPSVVKAESGVSDDLIKAVSEYYYYIPSNVRSSFENDGWQILIVNGNLNERMGYSSQIRGMTVFEDKTIYVDNRLSVADTILHEIAHYIDRKCEWPSDTSKFEDIWQKEASSLRSFWSTHSNNTSTPVEYFAEAYEAHLYTGNLKEYCPQTYDYIMKYSDSL